MLAWLDKLLAARGRATPIPSQETPLASPIEPELDAEGFRLQGNRLLDAGRLDEAASSYRQALSLDARSASALVNLGYVLIELGRQIEAAPVLDQALALDPTNVDANFMLGRIAVDQRDLPMGIDHFEKVLHAQPNFLLAYALLCRAHFDAGQAEQAKAVALAGLELDATLVDLHYHLGNILLLGGEAERAIASYRAALVLQPHYAEVRSNLGHALAKQGRIDEARESYLLALGDRPGSAEGCHHLGAGLQALGLLDQAAAAYRMALELGANHAPAHQDLGLVLQAQGKLTAALVSFERAAQLQPFSATAWCHLGSVHRDLRRHSEAEVCFRRGMAAQPQNAAPYAHLAVLEVERGDSAAALASFERALSLDPDRVDVRSNQLFTLCHEDRPELYLSAAREYGRRVSAFARPFTDWLVKPATKSPHPAPLRVGLVSGDLRSHPVGFFIESVLHGLAGYDIELCAFPTSHYHDDVTARLKSRCASWTSLVGVIDAVAAQRIRDERVHILIDLAGHSAHNRLPVFAWRPAPVQVTWLGYFASTGVPAMDYLLADDVSVPDEVLAQFTESVWRLPDTRLCFTEPGSRSAFPVSALPAERNGFVTLGCYQNMTKVRAPVLEAWRQVMEGLPTARLRLQNKQTGTDSGAKILAQLSAAGIDVARVVLAAPAARAAYLASYSEVDLLLDTFPFPGGTTTCEALWMGVPTVTLAGRSMLANQGKGMLTCAELQDWVAVSEADYVRRVIAHGSDLPGLSRLRATLRDRVVHSPLFDNGLFAARLASALFEIWQRGPTEVVAP